MAFEKPGGVDMLTVVSGPRQMTLSPNGEVTFSCDPHKIVAENIDELDL